MSILDQEDSDHRSPTPPVASPLTPPTEESLWTLPTLLQRHHSEVLPTDIHDNVRIMIRRRHVLADTLHKLRNGLDVTNNFVSLLLASLLWILVAL